jgi:hypothetical protein
LFLPAQPASSAGDEAETAAGAHETQTQAHPVSVIR